MFPSTIPSHVGTFCPKMSQNQGLDKELKGIHRCHTDDIALKALYCRKDF